VGEVGHRDQLIIC